MLREAWSENEGFAHRLGGPALRGSLDDQVFGVIALLDAYEATLEPRYFQAARNARWILPSINMAMPQAAAFSIGLPMLPPMGGLEVRRKPFQDSPTPSANSVAAMALTRMHAYTDEPNITNGRKNTLEAFAGVAPQYGLFRRDVWIGCNALCRASRPKSSSPTPQAILQPINCKKPPTPSIASAKQSCASRRKPRSKISPWRSVKHCRTCPKTNRKPSSALAQRACPQPAIPRN